MTPDATGRFKGISVPALPYKREGSTVVTETEFKAVLAQMHLVSYGTTGNAGGIITGSKERPLLPAGEKNALFHEFEARWRNARSIYARKAVYEEAKEALDRYKRSRAPRTPERNTFAWKRMIAELDVPYEEANRLHGPFTRTSYWRWRRDYRD